jgi:hypothetical protein
MSKRPRRYLCDGCTFAGKAGVVEGKIDCQTAGKNVEAITHVKGSRYESCRHRKSLPSPLSIITNPEKRAQVAFLTELARECKTISVNLDTMQRQRLIAEIEARLKIKYNQ